MREESTNTERRVTTRTDPQTNQEMDASSVRDWKPGLKPSRTAKPTTNGSADALETLLSQEGSTQKYKLNYPAWHKPYAEALLATDPETLMTLLEVTQAAVFERLLEIAACEDASSERQDLGRAIDVMLTLKARKT